MTQDDYVLGVDGGASKTIAIIARADDGTVVGGGRSGNADIYQTADAERHVAQAIEQAVAQADIAPTQIKAAALSLVGADWPEDFDHWHGMRERIGLGHLPQDRLSVVNDGIGGLESLYGKGAAVAVVCGTGAAVSARGADGATWHSSFWQRTQGAVELAETALDAVYLAELGIGQPTALASAALAHFDAENVTALLHMFSARTEAPLRNVGFFAPRLVKTADAGDEVARKILQNHANKLADYALAAARKVSIAQDTPVTLILSGGVFHAGSCLMTDHIWQVFQSRFPAAYREEKRLTPVVGAVGLALRLVGQDPSATLHDRISATLPDDDFFQTDMTPPSELPHEN